jgi:mRNA interferase MazF
VCHHRDSTAPTLRLMASQGVIQSDPYNASRLATTLAAVITSDTGLAAMPGNVFLPASSSGLPKDSVVNVTALVTVDKSDLGTEAGQVPSALMTM